MRFKEVDVELRGWFLMVTGKSSLTAFGPMRLVMVNGPMYRDSSLADGRSVVKFLVER